MWSRCGQGQNRVGRYARTRRPPSWMARQEWSVGEVPCCPEHYDQVHETPFYPKSAKFLTVYFVQCQAMDTANKGHFYGFLATFPANPMRLGGHPRRSGLAGPSFSSGTGPPNRGGSGPRTRRSRTGCRHATAAKYRRAPMGCQYIHEAKSGAFPRGPFRRSDEVQRPIGCADPVTDITAYAYLKRTEVRFVSNGPQSYRT